MKIFFSILNGVFVVLGINYFYSALGHIWSNGSDPTSIIPPSLFLGLFCLNVYSIWRFPGLIVSAFQIFFTICLGPLLIFAFQILVPVLATISQQLGPDYKVANLDHLVFIPYTFSLVFLLIAGYIAFNAYSHTRGTQA